MLSVTEIAGIAELVFNTAKRIHDQVQLVKANKAQCLRLDERVFMIETSIKQLQVVSNKDYFVQAIEKLELALNETCEFITSFSQDKWIKRMIKAGTHQEKFEEHNKNLIEAAQLLNLGINIQQVFNRQQDKEDEKQDRKALFASQDKILEMEKEAIGKLNQMDNKRIQEFHILEMQMESLKENMRLAIKGSNANKSPIPEDLQVPFYELAFDEEIAQGSFGVVFKGRYLGQTCAIKTIEGLLTEEDRNIFIREVAIMSKLRHSHITQFFGACLEVNRACLVMEYMPRGTLADVVKKHVLNELQRHTLLTQIANGLLYLHSRKVIHRDLKHTNILINQTMEAKISDFGLSQTKSLSVKTTKSRSQALAWQAPECLSYGGLYDTTSDIYSFGVMMWFVFTGKEPFANLSDSEIIKCVSAGGKEEIASFIPEGYANLIKQCWNDEKSSRPTIEQIVDSLLSLTPRPASPNGEKLYNQALEFENEGNYTQAAECYQEAIAKQFPKAFANYARFFLKSDKGFAIDKPKAFNLLEQGAALNHTRAMINLAQMLEYGDGIKGDLPRALSLYQQLLSLVDLNETDKTLANKKIASITKKLQQ